MTSSFVASRVVRSRVQDYDAPPAVVFALHAFREEKAWAVGWEPTAVYPVDGTPEEGAVFVVRRGAVEEIWILVEWNENARIARYVHVTADRDVTQIGIKVSGPQQGPSRVEVSYSWTGLSTAGNAFVHAQTEADFSTWMCEWEEEMAHYLRTGQKLERDIDES